MDNTGFYGNLYNMLYSKGYITNDTDSHIYEAQYAESGLLYSIDQTKILYDTVLDVGCGRGNGVAVFKGLGKEAFGVDISDIAVQAACKKGLNVVQGSITSVPHEDSKFDLVVSTDVIEHLREEDVLKALSELKRVSKKYVGVKIATDNERGTVEMIRSMTDAEKELLGGAENLHITVRPPEYWKNMMEKDLHMKCLHFKEDVHPDFGIICVRCVYEK